MPDEDKLILLIKDLRLNLQEKFESYMDLLMLWYEKKVDASVFQIQLGTLLRPEQEILHKKLTILLMSKCHVFSHAKDSPTYTRKRHCKSLQFADFCRQFKGGAECAIPKSFKESENSFHGYDLSLSMTLTKQLSKTLAFDVLKVTKANNPAVLKRITDPLTVPSLLATDTLLYEKAATKYSTKSDGACLDKHRLVLHLLTWKEGLDNFSDPVFELSKDAIEILIKNVVDLMIGMKRLRLGLITHHDPSASSEYVLDQCSLADPANSESPGDVPSSQPLKMADLYQALKISGNYHIPTSFGDKFAERVEKVMGTSG